MRIMRSQQPVLPAPPHPLMRVAAATSASPRRPGCTRLYFPQPYSFAFAAAGWALRARGRSAFATGEDRGARQSGNRLQRTQKGPEPTWLWALESQRAHKQLREETTGSIGLAQPAGDQVGSDKATAKGSLLGAWLPKEQAMVEV